MNQQPPGHDESDDVDDLYRRASALDSSRPSESVRKAVLAHAARLAEERASPRASGGTGARNCVRWRPAIFGTLAAAALAGLMIAPRFFAPSAPAPTAAALKAVPAPASAPPPPSVEVPAARSEPSAEPPLLSADGSAARFGAAPAPMTVPSADAPAAQSAAPVEPTAPSVAASEARFGAVPAPTAPSADASTAGSAPAVASTLTGAPALRADAPKPEAKRAQDNSMSLAEVTVTGARRGPRDQALAGAVTVGASPTELRRAAETGDLPALRRLLSLPVDIDSRDSLGRTALMLATLGSHAEAVNLLLDKGADPNVADNRGITPVQAAKAANSTAIVAALEGKGAR